MPPAEPAPRRTLPFAFALLFLVMAAGSSVLRQPASDAWPDYRGPRADGHSMARGLPLSWDATRNVRWRTPIPGKGWSTPVVWGRQIWLTTATADGRSLSIVCLDRETGGVVLNEEVFRPTRIEPISDVNSYASPSPVIEAGRVYVHFGTYGTACYDTRALKPIWKRDDLHTTHSVGPGSSPLLVRAKLVLTLDGMDTQYSVALDARTGRTVWRADRSGSFGPGREQRSERYKGFTSPIVTQVNGKPQIISPAAAGVYAYDPDTGVELWRVRHTGYSTASRTLVGEGMVYANTGYDQAELLAIRLGGSGDVTETHVAWRFGRNMPLKPSPILVGGIIYAVSDGGALSCLDAGTGELIWRGRLPGNYSASPVYAEGRLFFFNEQGKVTVLQPGREPRVIAESTLPEGFMASAAIAGRSFFLRTRAAVYRVEAGGAAPGRLRDAAR